MKLIELSEAWNVLSGKQESVAPVTFWTKEQKRLIDEGVKEGNKQAIFYSKLPFAIIPELGEKSDG